MHKDFIICHFNGRPPPFSLIQSVLNHMWGKGKRVEIHNNPLARSMLVRIPSDSLRQKIIEKNVWHIGDSMFHASQWSSSLETPERREAIQIWAHLTGVPLDLRYREGLSLVAGLIGEPKETDEFTLNLVSLTLSHVKVEVNLSQPLPSVVEFVRQSGEVVEVQVDYPWVPPTCAHCKELGHISKNCLLLPDPNKNVGGKNQKIAPKVAKPVTAVPQYIPKLPQKHAPPTGASSSSAQGKLSPQANAILSTSTGPTLKTACSLPLLPFTAVAPDPKTPSPPSVPPSINPSPQSFISSEAFLFNLSHPATTQKDLLKRSFSNPDLQKFPSFSSHLASYSSLTPFLPLNAPSLDQISAPIPPVPLSSATPTSNSFDILASSGALLSEEHHSH